MILLIDNYDSFTYNLVQALSSQGAGIAVYRNDALTAAAADELAPEGLIISPGPCSPNEAGISVELIKHFAGRIPILGVCLGHQCIGAAFGGVVDAAGSIMHGKTSMVKHDGTGLYRGIKNPFPAGRYHSLAVLRGDLPECLVVDAETEDGEIMGLHHAAYQIYGVQFHPESVLTPSGKRLLRNFLEIIRQGGGK